MLLPTEQTISIGGVEYRLSKFTLPLYQEFLAWAAGQLPDPFANISEKVKGLDEKLAKYMIDKAEDRASKRGTMNDPDTAALAQSVVGVKKLFSLLFRKYHPTLSEDQVGELVEAGISEHGGEAFQKFFPA